MKIAIITNLPAPYRVDLFNSIDSERDVDLLALFASKGHVKRRRWPDQRDRMTFQWKFLPSKTFEYKGGAIDLAFAAGRALSAFQPSVVVVAGWDQPAAWGARRWAIRHDVPFVTWTESALLTGQRRGYLSTLIRKRFFSGASLAIVPGQAAADFVQLHSGVTHCVVPNSVEAEFAGATDARECRKRFLFIGELTARKGLDLILERIEELRELGTVTIAGHGEFEPEVREMAAHGLLDYVGSVNGEERLELYRAHEILLLPSRHDPWPLVAVEALTMGMGVIVGPGVGSGTDLAALAQCAVEVMSQFTGDQLVAGATKLIANPNRPLPTSMFLPDVVAQGMVGHLRSVKAK